MSTSISTHNIKAKSHILSLLGEQLIGSDNLAIFELVKNSYDADANNVVVEFIDLNTPDQKIIIEDDGHGMSPEVIQNVWLTIGTDYKRGEKRKPSPRYKRTSLGNKGVGRFAVHILAKEIVLETQTFGSLFSNRLKINWANLIASGEYIQDLKVEIELVGQPLFPKGQGTRIILSQLTTEKWSKSILRDLARKIESIKNPFVKFGNFDIEIKANNPIHQEWLSGIKSSIEILEDSLYQFQFELKKSNLKKEDLAAFSWHYKFNPHSLTQINENSDSKTNIPFLVGDKLVKIEKEEDNNKYSKYLKNYDIEGIGTIKGRFYVFNQNSKLFKMYFGGQTQAIKEYIFQNCGVKIFRDNIRVYNYGESSDDWLGLDLLKIQRIGDHFGKKTTIGVIELNINESENGLKEKTNREGFIENKEFKVFQTIVSNIYQFFEQVASKDKEKIDAYINQIEPVKKIGLSETIQELSSKIKDKSLEKELNPLIKRVEKDYNEMRDVMLNSGMAGLNLGVIFHEVDREIKFINIDLNSSDIKISEIKSRVKNLIQILENFSPILKQNKKIKTSASLLVNRAKQINISRFSYHNIIFSSPLLSNENPDFEIFGPANLLTSVLSNLIDNALYWISAKKDLEGQSFKGGLYIGTDLISFKAPAIIIADNGTGFNIEPEELIQPFRTTKPGGMGLGLYFSNLVMEMIGGKLIFPDSEELDIPKAYNGACIVLVFPK